jgi:hypothetical protein
MGIKDLLGFCLLMIGLGLAILLVPFLMNQYYFNHLFLITLGICAGGSLFFGAFILHKSN